MTDDLRYRDLERAASEVLEVGPAAMGAFRARLRHLRNLGVPKVAGRGSGTQIAYTRENVYATVVALELQRLGNAPKFVERAVNFLEELWPEIRRAKVDKLLCIAASKLVPREEGTERAPLMTVINRNADSVDFALRKSRTASFVNLSEIIRAADEALK